MGSNPILCAFYSSKHFVVSELVEWIKGKDFAHDYETGLISNISRLLLNNDKSIYFYFSKCIYCMLCMVKGDSKIFKEF